MLSVGLWDEIPSDLYVYICSTFGYCYHNVNVINLTLLQSDLIKLFLLYQQFDLKKTTNLFTIEPNSEIYVSYRKYKLSP
jgi:hypothetical protein